LLEGDAEVVIRFGVLRASANRLAKFLKGCEKLAIPR
jgi:hypothetical protein